MLVFNNFEQILLVCVLVTLGLGYVNAKRDWPFFALLSRWVRWFMMAFCMALLIYRMQEGQYPFVLLFITTFLVWFLIETSYNWWVVQALSKSPLPLFPRFKACTVLEAWPVDAHWLRIKESIQAEGFKPVVGSKSVLFEGIYLASVIFERIDKSCRLQVIFLPQKKKNYLAAFSFSTLTASGLKYVTDNIRMPFGGFYPENWRVLRKPLVYSFRRLLKKHDTRLKKDGQVCLTFDNDPLRDINDQQQNLESLNTQLGFLRPHSLEGPQGRISSEGLYRVWKEWWLMNYFGFSRKV
ncbi:MAG: hypothetical protein B7X06_04350 [Verrucomicrobia bacterium 21-51-4]|nr:MAG: hypothetical protein B7X06_04350 [Verrucomicrobia bacterium 21-51-4]